MRLETRTSWAMLYRDGRTRIPPGAHSCLSFNDSGKSGARILFARAPSLAGFVKKTVHAHDGGVSEARSAKPGITLANLSGMRQ